MKNYFFLHVLDTLCYGFKANKSCNYISLYNMENMACFKNKNETNNIILRTRRTKKKIIIRNVIIFQNYFQ
jgi:hypothetical protein